MGSGVDHHWSPLAAVAPGDTSATAAVAIKNGGTVRWTAVSSGHSVYGPAPPDGAGSFAFFSARA